MDKYNKNNLCKGDTMHPLHVLILFVVFYIVLEIHYMNVINKEVEKYASSIKNLNEMHNQYEKSIMKKIRLTNEYHESVIRIKDGQINRLKNEIQSNIENNIILPLGEFEATAYDLSVDSCGKRPGDKGYGKTARGVNLVNLSRRQAMSVAVDPNIIPLGTKLYIEFAEPFTDFNGVYVANDTGSAIKGNIVDVFLGDFNSIKTSQEVWEFGRRKVKIYKLLNQEGNDGQK